MLRTDRLRHAALAADLAHAELAVLERLEHGEPLAMAQQLDNLGGTRQDRGADPAQQAGSLHALASRVSSWSRRASPTWRPISLPPLNAMRVGIPRIPNRWVTPWCWSVSTLMTRTSPAFAKARSSTT